jgi:pyrroloquinoline quinone (PQQ) biosynthesis protein C
MTSELLRAVRDELDRCAVGRDNPTHRRLIAGGLTPAELEVWVGQQWLWHRAFPGVLAALAAQCPLLELRRSLLRRAAREDGALPGEGPGRCDEWERVAGALGVKVGTLASVLPTTETEAMIAIQRMVAARPFAEGWIGIMVGVDGETISHSPARRRALKESYGVPEEALAYVRLQEGDPVAEAVAIVEPLPGDCVSGALEALRLVLHARWNYFSAVGRASVT